jgi:hypothetical protein
VTIGRRTARATCVASIVVGGVVGCASTAGRPSTPSTPSRDLCYVADRSAPPPDTLYVIDPHPMDVGALTLGCGDTSAVTPLPPSANVVHVSLPPGMDLRDVLDAGLSQYGGRRPDVAVTNEPAVLGYAARDSTYVDRALPWNRTYIFIAPGAVNAAALPTDAERDGLARDAVRAEARGAERPFPWQSDSACTGPSPDSTFMPARVIGYDASDAAARQLAERLLALASSGQPPAWIPAAMAGPELALRPLPHDSVASALRANRIGAAVSSGRRGYPWMCGALGPVPPGHSAVALIDTRDHVLVRLGSGARFYVTRDGSLWFARETPP